MGDDITNSHLLTCNLYASSPLVAYDLVNSHSLEDHPADHPMDGRSPGHKRSEGAATYDPMISDDPPTQDYWDAGKSKGIAMGAEGKKYQEDFEYSDLWPYSCRK